MLRMEKASLEYKLSDYQELLTAKISLEYENSKLKAACHATTAIKESPDLLNNVRGKKYFETKIEKYESEIDSLKTVIKDLETHLDDLKTTIEEQKLVRTAEESARNLLVKRVEAAERHARVVENQLTIYDHAEKLYLDAEKVDQLKIKRINELEELVRSLEKQLLEQTKDMAEQQVKQAIQEKPIIQVNHGPYYELTSGVRITEFLTDLFNKEKEHFEELTQLNIIKENLEMKYKAAEAQISELQKAISLRSSLTSNKMISSSIKVEPISSSTESVLLSATNNTAMDTTVEEATDDDNKKYRILELKDNPASREYAIRKELLNNLRQENHDLRQQLFTQSSTLPDSSWTNLEAEKSSLTTECETLRKRIKRMLTAYDTNIQKNMTHIKSLLGYSVFFHDSGLIRLESIWADPVDLHFMVKIDDESGHAILRITGKERDRYMAYLEDSYQMYVVHDRNIAAFLSAAALELYVEYKGEEQLKERQQKERQQQQQLEQEQVEFELQENESLEDEQQQQQQQEYLQQDRKQQEHEQDENKHEEGQEYEREDEQQELQEPQQQQQEQQHEEEVTVEEEDYEYVEDDDMPVEEDDMPVEEDDMPVEEDDMPVEEDDMPVEEDDMPVEEDDMPVEEDDMPVEEEYMPVEEDEYDYEEGEESYVEEEVDMPEIIENHKGPSFVVHIDDSE
ncbi:uncharacterized protein BX663DRAFT_138348 [Cokeromyces recurvatus]|uniref:uncharacterized protein n=1 Tax=Cokeromyces recurvatus TaxID=90255 RepID=UPI00221F810B|nr:uncharacterized protein BX663DRAFT_138348 [Cokeromyces recurvatus]KAI7900884.1 hypothetical protein BX663DRAFT_138348 [Cokeromyces recurvatus]